jgi:hypothetical protein
MADRDDSVRFSWNAGDRFMQNLNPIIVLFDATCERCYHGIHRHRHV